MADSFGLDFGLNFDSVDQNDFNPPAANDDFSDLIDFDFSAMPMTNFFDDAFAEMDAGLDAAALDAQIAATMKSASATGITEGSVAGQVVPTPQSSSTAVINPEAASLGATTTEIPATTGPEPARTLVTDKPPNSSISGEAVPVTTPVRPHEGTACAADLQQISPPPALGAVQLQSSALSAVQEVPSAPVSGPHTPSQASIPQQQFITPVAAQDAGPTLPIAPKDIQTTEQSAFLPVPSSSDLLDCGLSNFDFDEEMSAWFPPTTAQSGLGELDTSLPVASNAGGTTRIPSANQPSAVNNNMDMNITNTDSTITAQTPAVVDVLQHPLNSQVRLHAEEVSAPAQMTSEVFTDTSVYTDQNNGYTSDPAANQQDPQQSLTTNKQDARPDSEHFSQAFIDGHLPRTPMIYTAQRKDLDNAVLCTPFVSPFHESPFDPSPCSTLSYPQQATPQQSGEVDWVALANMPFQPDELAMIGQAPLAANPATPAPQAKPKVKAQVPATGPALSKTAAGKRKRAETDTQGSATKHVRTNSAPQPAMPQYEMAPLVQGSQVWHLRQPSYEQPHDWFPAKYHSHGPSPQAAGQRSVHPEQYEHYPQQHYQLPQEQPFHHTVQQSSLMDKVFPSEMPAEFLAMQQSRGLDVLHSNQVTHQSGVLPPSAERSRNKLARKFTNIRTAPPVPIEQEHVHQQHQYMHQEQQYNRHLQPNMPQQQQVMYRQQPAMHRQEQHVVYEQAQDMHYQQAHMYHERRYMHQEEPIIHGQQQYMPAQQQQYHQQAQMEMQGQYERQQSVPQPKKATAKPTRKAATKSAAASSATARTTKAATNNQTRADRPQNAAKTLIEASQASWRQDPFFGPNGPVWPAEYFPRYDYPVPVPTGILLMTEEYEKIAEKRRQDQLAAEAAGTVN